MRVFTCNNFYGFWPVGTAAVIVAADYKDALKQLTDALAFLGLAQDDQIILTELGTDARQCVILNDGSY